MQRHEEFFIHQTIVGRAAVADGPVMHLVTLPKLERLRMLVKWIDTRDKLLLLALCAPLYSAAHLFNAWVFQHLEYSLHISWIYLPAFLRVAYVLVLGPSWGFMAIFTGSLLLGGTNDENLLQSLVNACASALGPVLALRLFKLLKERSLQLSRGSDLVQLCLLYAMLNALIHHVAWTYLQPNQLMAVSQLPIMVTGDLVGTLFGAWVFTQVVRRLGLYREIERLSKVTTRG
ncbi:MAG: hypothetical protein EBZ60_01735 [Betaproteobacteria bacterium]|nr:hypothetical protein [Betaproteobacteria bacterium]